MSESTNSLIADDESFGNAPIASPATSGGALNQDIAGQTAQKASDMPTRQQRGRPKRNLAQDSIAQSQIQLGTMASEFDDSANTNEYNFSNQELPPIPGHEQVYVTYRIHGEENLKQVMEYLQRGFRARQRDTVPSGFHVFSMKMDRTNMFGVDFGNVVCNQDRILMTRPTELGKRERNLAASQDEEIRAQILQGAQGLEIGVKPIYHDTQVGQYDPGSDSFRFPTGI